MTNGRKKALRRRSLALWALGFCGLFAFFPRPAVAQQLISNFTTGESEEGAQFFETQTGIGQYRLERLSLDNDSWMNRNDRAAAVQISPENSVAGSGLPRQIKARSAQNSDQLFYSYGGKTLTHLDCNGDETHGYGSGSWDGLAMSFEVFQKSADCGAHFAQRVLKRFPLNVTAGKAWAIGKVTAFFASFNEHGILINRFFCHEVSVT